MNGFRRIYLCMLLLYCLPAVAFNWHDLWETPNHQGQKAMQAKNYTKAHQKFKRLDWRATAAYRAGNYPEAASIYQTLQEYYNQGNALAHMGQYAQAIKAYEKAIAQNASQKDAIHNRKIIEALLKKQQQKQHSSAENGNQKPGRNQNQDSNQQNNSGSSSQQQPQNGQELNQNSQQNQSQEQGQSQEQKQNHEPTATHKSAENSEVQQDQVPVQSKQSAMEQSGLSQAEQEQKQANEQWLRLIPDDPGGFLREKFRRDYLQRQNR